MLSHPVYGTLLTASPENGHTKELEKTTQTGGSQYYQRKQGTLRTGFLAQWRPAHCSSDTEREQPTAVGSPYCHVMTGAQLGKRTLTMDGRKRPPGPAPQLPCPARPLSQCNQTAPSRRRIFKPLLLARFSKVNNLFQPEEFLHRSSGPEPKHGPPFHSSAMGISSPMNSGPSSNMPSDLVPASRHRAGGDPSLMKSGKVCSGDGLL